MPLVRRFVMILMGFLGKGGRREKVLDSAFIVITLALPLLAFKMMILRLSLRRLLDCNSSLVKLGFGGFERLRVTNFFTFMFKKMVHYGLNGANDIFKRDAMKGEDKVKTFLKALERRLVKFRR